MSPSLTALTWNLAQISPGGPRGRAQTALLDARGADLWFLTEVPEGRRHDGRYEVRSSLRTGGGGRMSWCAVSTTSPLEPLPSPSEALALAVEPELDLLLACSVMPWRGARHYYHGDAAAPFAERFRDNLAEHLAAIRSAAGRRKVIWGGDFNQALEGPERVGSQQGRQDLLAALAELGLQAPTAGCPSQSRGCRSIDHVFVPADWSAQAAVVEPGDGRPLSDHELYVVSATRSPRVPR